MDNQRGIRLKLTIIWLAILLVGSFWLTVNTSTDMVRMTVIPQAPREGEPIIATFKLNNPSAEALLADYQFYANGRLLKEGTAIIAADSSKTYKYAYENPLQVGEQLNFVVRTRSELGEYENIVSSPPFPPQICSSFISFASFSTSVMSSMSTMIYYESAFGSDMGLNVGIIITVVLIAMLIFLELTHPLLREKTIAVLGRLRIRFSAVTWILLIIFIGIVYTKVAMIMAT